MTITIKTWLTATALALLTLTGCATGDKSTASGKGWITLVDGRSLNGWVPLSPESTWQTAGEVTLDPADPTKLAITPGSGIIVNGTAGKTSNIYSQLQHGDCEAHIEFLVSKGSNSGVYFMGKYEVQILDSYGKPEVGYQDCGAIYPRWINDTNVEGHAPRVNASRAPGEWQSFDVIFRAPRFDANGNKVENARFVRVVHNGQIIHENVVLNGPTRAAIEESKEIARGPLMLQGDHGPVAYRNVRIKPLD